MNQPVSDDEARRCYYGAPAAGADADNLLEVQRPVSGPTERYERNLKLRSLTPPADAAGFTWGYIGTGPLATGRAILADALDAAAEDVNDLLLNAFVIDVVSQFPSEFRIGRGAVLRWARGWLAGCGVPNPVAPIGNPPPIQVGQWKARS